LRPDCGEPQPRRDAEAKRFGKSTHAQELHHARAVNLDRAHAELVADHLVGPAIDQSLQYFAFA
jgi:hypothetical protein